MNITVIIPVFNQEELVVRAIESVPQDWNIIIVNDGSTDGTLKAIIGSLRPNDTLISYNTNKGVSYALNRAWDIVKSDYVLLLGSDDFLYPEIVDVSKELDGTDLVFFNLKYNDGHIIDLCEENMQTYCGSVKFMRTNFVSNIRNDEKMEYNEDSNFMKDLLSKNPTTKFTHIVGKHYNHPRIGSLNWRAINESGNNNIQS